MDNMILHKLYYMDGERTVDMIIFQTKFDFNATIPNETVLKHPAEFLKKMFQLNFQEDEV